MLVVKSREGEAKGCEMEVLSFLVPGACSGTHSQFWYHWALPRILLSRLLSLSGGLAYTLGLRMQHRLSLQAGLPALGEKAAHSVVSPSEHRFHSHMWPFSCMYLLASDPEGRRLCFIHVCFPCVWPRAWHFWMSIYGYALVENKYLCCHKIMLFAHKNLYLVWR